MQSYQAKVRLLAAVLFPLAAWSQNQGASFGEVVRLGGTPSDLVLDESRSRLYLVNSNANRVDVYNYGEKRVERTIGVGSRPLAAAMSMDNRYLYVTNNDSSSLSVIDLSNGSNLQTVSLPAKPEGVEVGFDGRALITTEGTSTTDQINSLLLFDRNQQSGQQITTVAFAPPPVTPAPLNQVFIGRPTTTFRGKLTRTPDGRFIIGLSLINNSAQTIAFVYECSSASILRSRTVTGQSTVLSISPDGARFMAGFSLYETATLNVLGQYSSANVPFPLASTGTANFNSTQNMGGSAFSLDGETLYSAFNVAPVTTPATKPQASTLLISNPRNLLVKLGIKIPESIIAKMAITSSGEQAWGLSESGMVYLPIFSLFDYPIVMPETTAVFLAVDSCNPGLAKASLRIDNLGKGTLTYSVPDATAALSAQATSGVTPSSISFTMEPGRTGVTRQYGTNLYSGAVTNQGTPLTINISSPEAINIPNTVKVYMNNRQADQRGVVYPVPTNTGTAEGLYDILVDETRDVVYVSNSGYNRIEVFDRAKQRFISPIEVGQFPHQMAFGRDGSTLYVANTGGETISIVDLDAKKIKGTVRFPARPRSGTSNPVSPQAIAFGLSGLQIIMSDGSKWKVIGDEATTRPADNVTPTQFTVTAANGPVRMLSNPEATAAVVLGADGTTYLYDAIADAFTNSTRPYTTTAIQTYFGALAAGPEGSFLAANSFIFGPSLSVTGGSESPTATNTLPLATPRNVAAVAAVDQYRMVRMTTPVKQTITTTPNSDARTTLDLIDFRDNSVSIVGAVADNPVNSRFGTTRVNVPARQMVVDSKGDVYAITLAGMTVIPLTPAGLSRPQIASGATSVVNATDGSRNIRPGSFVLISGTNLATSNISDLLPVPSVLGGSCVTFSETSIPILQTSSEQILGQVPQELVPGNYVLRVRSLATGQQSDPIIVTVQR